MQFTIAYLHTIYLLIESFDKMLHVFHFPDFSAKIHLAQCKKVTGLTVIRNKQNILMQNGCSGYSLFLSFGQNRGPPISGPLLELLINVSSRNR